MSAMRTLSPKVVSAAIPIVAICGIGSRWLPAAIAPYATLLAVAALMLLLRRAAQLGLFSSGSGSLRAPRVRTQWDVRAIKLGILLFACGLLWGVAFALGIKLQVIDRLPISIGWLLISPALVFMLLGVLMGIKGTVGREKRL